MSLPASLRRALADHRMDLAETRAEVQRMQEGTRSRLETLSRALDTLAAERADLERDRVALRASLKDKTKVETELRERLATARRDLKATEAAHIAVKDAAARDAAARDAELALLRDERDSAERRIERDARENAAAAAAAAGNTSRADRMTSSALRAELAAAREEIEVSERARRSETSELRATFRAKLAEMREVHAAKMSSALELAASRFTTTAASRAEPDALLTGSSENGNDATSRVLSPVRVRDLEEAEAEAEAKALSAERLLRATSEDAVEQRRRAEAAEIERDRALAELERALHRVSMAESATEMARRQVSETAAVLRVETEAAAASEAIFLARERDLSRADANALELMEARVVNLADLLRMREKELAATREIASSAAAERAESERCRDALTRERDALAQKVRELGQCNETQEEVDPRKQTSAAEAALAKANWRQASRREGIHGPASRSRAFKST
jgi:hypothetical protein